MIALLIGLLLFAHERIYSGYLSYGNLNRVVEAKGWQGTEGFDVLLATPDCGDVSRWAWVITEGEVYEALIVDCSEEWNDKLGLVADTNRDDLTHQWAWVVMR